MSVFEPPVRWQRGQLLHRRSTHIIFNSPAKKDKNNATVKFALCVGEKLLSTAKNHDFSVHLQEAVCVSVNLQHVRGAANGF